MDLTRVQALVDMLFKLDAIVGGQANSQPGTTSAGGGAPQAVLEHQGRIMIDHENRLGSIEGFIDSLRKASGESLELHAPIPDQINATKNGKPPKKRVISEQGRARLKDNAKRMVATARREYRNRIGAVVVALWDDMERGATRATEVGEMLGIGRGLVGLIKRAFGEECREFAALPASERFAYLQNNFGLGAPDFQFMKDTIGALGLKMKEAGIGQGS